MNNDMQPAMLMLLVDAMRLLELLEAHDQAVAEGSEGQVLIAKDSVVEALRDILKSPKP